MSDFFYINGVGRKVFDWSECCQIPKHVPSLISSNSKALASLRCRELWPPGPPPDPRCSPRRRCRRRLCVRSPTLMATCWLTAPATSAPATSPASPWPAAPCAPPRIATRSGTASSGRDSNASLLCDSESGIHHPLVHPVARLPSTREKFREQWFPLGLSVNCYLDFGDGAGSNLVKTFVTFRGHMLVVLVAAGPRKVVRHKHGGEGNYLCFLIFSYLDRLLF